MLKILEFVHNNKNWEDLLSEKPYSLKIKRDSGFIMFSYSQIDSNFYEEVVRESRGIIFHEETWTPVCVPFFKFGNWGEGYSDKVDWSSARVQEKVDGSIIKLWYWNYEWHVSTNGTIDARNAELGSDMSRPEYIKNYFDLFLIAAFNCGLNVGMLDRNKCYMFELVSPYNKIVVPHDKTGIYHIGTRDMSTLLEVDENIGIQKPKEYSLSSLDECIGAVQKLPFNDEGYVVVDGDWKRIKIKSPAYVAVHHMRENGALNMKAVVTMVLITNEVEEYLIYFPEHSEVFERVYARINEVESQCYHEWDDVVNSGLIENGTRKDIALFIKTKKYQPYLFAMLDGRVSNPLEWMRGLQVDKLVYLLEE